MNLTIPRGYRLAAGTDIDLFLDRLPAVMDPIRDRLDGVLFTDLALTSIDNADAGGRPRPAHPMAEAYAAWADDQQGMNPHMVWHDPHHLNIRTGFDEATGRHLIMVHGDSEYADQLILMPEVQEYRYFSFIEDIPQGITEAEWEARGAAWNRLLPDFKANDALRSWDLREVDDPRTAALVAAIAESDELVATYAKDLRRRARRVAVNRYSYWLSEQGAEIMSAVTDAFRAELDALCTVTRPLLAPATARLLADGVGNSGFADIPDEDWSDLLQRDHAVETAKADTF